MWSYDLIKRNKCLITIGETPHCGLSLVTENGTNSPAPAGSPAEGESRADGPVYQAGPQHGAVSVPCYFLKPPEFNFSSEFSEANDLVSTMLGGIGDAIHTANLALPAVNELNGQMDNAMSFGESMYGAIRQSFSTDKGVSKEQFSADKRKTVITALQGLGNIAKQVGSHETKTFRTGKVVDWKGANPVEFTLEVLFCKPDDGVYMGSLYPIIEASGFSEIAFGSYMYGPRGYNSAGFGIGAIERILNGEFKSLHSLRLWYDASEEFASDQARSTHVILDLFRLLVITSLKIDRPEQLFFDPSKPEESAPLYKWIKATIGFKTACPVPGSLFAQGKGDRSAKGFNASLHDFYGPMKAPGHYAYPAPITDKGLKPKLIPGQDDIRRLVGN